MNGGNEKSGHHDSLTGGLDDGYPEEASGSKNGHESMEPIKVLGVFVVDQSILSRKKTFDASALHPAESNAKSPKVTNKEVPRYA